MVFSQEGEEVLQGYGLVGGVPRNGETHGESCGKQRAEGEAFGAEMLDSRGDDGDAFAGFDEGEDAGPGGGCVDDIGREAFGGAERDDAVEERWSGFAVGDDETLVSQGTNVDGLAGETVVGAHDREDGIAIEELGAQDTVEGRFERAGEADIDAAVFERGDLLGCVHLHERKPDAGATAAELTDDAREETAGAPQEEADGERTDFAVEGFLSEVDGAVGGLQGHASLFEENLAFRGKPNGAAGAIEEHAANFAFEIEHLFADGGLRDVKLARGSGETSGVSDCGEIAQVTEFHEGYFSAFEWA